MERCHDQRILDRFSGLLCATEHVESHCTRDEIGGVWKQLDPEIWGDVKSPFVQGCFMSHALTVKTTSAILVSMRGSRFSELAATTRERLEIDIRFSATTDRERRRHALASEQENIVPPDIDFDISSAGSRTKVAGTFQAQTGRRCVVF